MDIEKAIEFIMNSQADAEVRLAKVEALVAQRRLDEQINNPVSGIGEFMRLNPSPITSPQAR